MKFQTLVSIALIVVVSLATIQSASAVDTVVKVTGSFITYKAGINDMMTGGRTITLTSNAEAFPSDASLITKFKLSLTSITYPSSPPSGSLTHANTLSLIVAANFYASTDNKQITFTFPPLPNYNADKDELFKIDIFHFGVTCAAAAAGNCFAQVSSSTAVAQLQTKIAETFIPAITQIGGTAFIYGATKQSLIVGGQTILIKLAGSTWSPIVPASEVQLMITGSLSTTNSWKDTKALLTNSMIDRISDTMLRIRLPPMPSYDNGSTAEVLTITATANAVTTNSIVATDETISIAISTPTIGLHWIQSVTGSFRNYIPSKADVQAGGRRIAIQFGHTDASILHPIATLRGATAMATINAMITSGVAADDGSLKAEVSAKLAGTDVFRTSDNVLTIVLPATVSASYATSVDDWIRFNIGNGMKNLFLKTGPSTTWGTDTPLIIPMSSKVADAQGAFLKRFMPFEFTDVDGVTLKIINSAVRVPCLQSVGGTFWSYPPTTGDIRAGNRFIELTISGAVWASPISQEAVRAMLVGSLPASATTWETLKSNIVLSNINRVSDTVLRVYIPALPTYDQNPITAVVVNENISVLVNGNSIGLTTNLAVSSQVLTILDTAPGLRTPAIVSVTGTFVSYKVYQKDVKTLGGRTIIIKIDGTVLSGSTYLPITWAAISGAGNTVLLSDFKSSPMIRNWIKGGASADEAIIDAIVANTLTQLHIVRTNAQTLTITIPPKSDGVLSDAKQVVVVDGACFACIVNSPSGGVFEVAAVNDVPLYRITMDGSGGSSAGAPYIASVSGTLVIFPPTKADIQLGGRSVEITIGHAVFASTITGTMAQTMLNSVSGGTGPTRFNTLKNLISTLNVMRLSDTKIRITLPPMSRYVNGDYVNSGEDDFISISVPDNCLTASAGLATFPVTFLVSNNAGNTPAIISLSNTAIFPLGILNTKDLGEGCFERLEIDSSVAGTTNTVTVTGLGTCMASGTKVVLMNGSSIGVSDGVYSVSTTGNAKTIQLKDSQGNVVSVGTACSQPCTTSSNHPTLVPLKAVATTRRFTINISGDTFIPSLTSSVLINISKAADDSPKLFNGSGTSAASFDTIFSLAAASQCAADAWNAAGCLLLTRDSDTQITVILPPIVLTAAETIIVTIPGPLLISGRDIAVHTSQSPDQPTGFGPNLDFRFQIAVTPGYANIQVLAIGGTAITSPPSRLDLVQGGRTIEITINPAATWKLDGANPHADIITYLSSLIVGSGTSFNQFIPLIKQANLSVYGGATAANVLTISLPPLINYNNGADESISVNVDSRFLASIDQNADSTPDTFTLPPFPKNYFVSNAVVAYAPGAPWQVQIKNNDADTYRCVFGFTVSWEKPYGYPLYYEAQRDQGRTQSDGGTLPTGAWQTFYNGTAQEAKAVGLNRFYWYRVRVRATSALGTGPWSFIITINTRPDGQGKSGTFPNSRPIAPIVVGVLGIGATTMTLNVTANAVCPDDIANYVIVYRLSSYIENQITTSYNTNPMRFQAAVSVAYSATTGWFTATLTGLIPATTYTVGAVAVAQAGWKSGLGYSYSIDAGTLALENTDIVLTKFITMDLLSIKAVPSPFEGPIEGNTLITVSGNGFYKGVQCKIGAASPVSATVISATQLTCLTPRSPISGIGDQIVTIIAINSNDANSQQTILRYFNYHSSILISDFKSNSILRFHADSGAFIDTFVASGAGKLDGPWGMAFSSIDLNLYVSSEGTSSVLLFNGNTGTFMSTFCTVKGQPRGLTFHQGLLDSQPDLYVASAYGDAVYRYNGISGSTRGIYASDPLLDNPWGVAFSNNPIDQDMLYVSSEYTDAVLRFNVPPATNRGALKFQGVFVGVYTDTKCNYANGLDLNIDSLYVTGPYSGNAIVRYNRLTGKYINHFQDPDLKYPVDVKIYSRDVTPNSSFPELLYVCSENQIRKYHPTTGEFLGIHSKYDTLMCSSMYFHKNWNVNTGK